MKERPILFSGPMVRAILDGRKTQTRRIVKPAVPADVEEINQRPALDPVLKCVVSGNSGEWEDTHGLDLVYRCPYGIEGDRLWVKETHCYVSEGGTLEVAYRADNWSECPADDGKWKPSIFCTRAASRLTLEITEVRVQRLQEITEEDARAEGCPLDHLGNHYNPPPPSVDSWQGYGRYSYSLLWSKINGPGSWDHNPWVWVLTFRKLNHQK